MTTLVRTAAFTVTAFAIALCDQTPKPSPQEEQLAKQIATLPAAQASAAVADLPAAQITEGLGRALELMSAASKDNAEAERLARLAVAAAERGNFIQREAAAEFVLGRALSHQANHYDAVEVYGRSLDHYQQSGGSPGLVAAVFGSRATSRNRLGDMVGALDDAQRALDLAQQSGDVVLVARQLNTIGSLQMNLGDFRRALEAFEKSLKIARDKNEKLGEAFVLNNIGGVYGLEGDYRMAVDYELRSLRLKEALGKTNESVTSLINLGDDCSQLGRTAEARRYLEQALRIARAQGLKLRIGQALKISATMDFDQHQYRRGIVRLEEARAMLEQAGERLEETTVLSNIAAARLQLGQYAEAVGVAQQARDLARQISGPVVLEQAALILGQAFHEMGKLTEAREALAESMAAMEELRENIGGAESARETYLAGHTDAYREMLTIEMTGHKGEAAFRLAEQSKGRALLDLLHGGRPELDRFLSTQERQREVALKARLMALRGQRAAAEQVSDLDSRIEKARLELSVFHSELYAAHPELRTARGDVPPILVTETASLLPSARAVLLEYVVTPRRTYLFVITRGPSGPVLKTHVVPIGQHTLNAAVSRFREQIASRDPGFADAARKLYGWLIQPAAQELAGKSSLVIVPDDELWRLPFQALQADSGRFLAQDVAVSYTPSLSVLHALLANRTGAAGKPQSLMVLANPSGNTPEAEREAQAIDSLYGAANSRVWRGPAATSDIFRSEAGKFDVVHIAAHGVFDDRNPMVSHLILSPPAQGPREDGWIEAGEVRSMQLKSALVVLSGCETARGHFENGEGAVGLSWAFLAAGARATVASQWRVESFSTSTLMVAFHKAMLEGAGGAEALRRAGLKLLATERYHHPFYWAGFELLGAW